MEHHLDTPHQSTMAGKMVFLLLAFSLFRPNCRSMPFMATTGLYASTSIECMPQMPALLLVHQGH
jgi:hypothetical protein